MVEFKLIYGDRASLWRAVLARISRSNKLPVGFLLLSGVYHRGAATKRNVCQFHGLPNYPHQFVL
jgi:hypothetical protein